MNQYEVQESHRKYSKEIVDLFKGRMYGRTLPELIQRGE
jgi:hypothetical protein